MIFNASAFLEAVSARFLKLCMITSVKIHILCQFWKPRSISIVTGECEEDFLFVLTALNEKCLSI